METLPNNHVESGKTIAIISYITWIGTLLAFIMNTSKKNPFASFHIRQMIGLGIFQLLNWWVVFQYLGKIAGGIVSFILFVLWIIGFMGAIRGEKKLIPVLGEYFQNWFKGI